MSEDEKQDDKVQQDPDHEDGVGSGLPEGADGKEESGGKRKRKRKRKKKESPEQNETGGETPDQTKHTDSVELTVYVEGIPFDSTADQVKEFFTSNGVLDVVELRLPTWQDSGRLRGYGHVLLDSSESYETALGLSGKYMGKRYLTIQAAKAPSGGAQQSFSRPDNSSDPPPEDCLTLFVNNLPYNATEEQVSQAFDNLGDIAEDGVRIARNSVTRQSKGFCYIDFETPKDAQNVMKVCAKQRITVGGRMVRLDYDTGRMKGSYRAESGRLWTKESKEKKRQRVGH